MVLTFSVNSPEDWKPVSEFLTEQATTEPLAQPDVENASKSEKVATGQAALVIHRHTTAISIVFAREPGNFHLSASKVVSTKAAPMMMRLPDDIAAEAATHLLGDGYKEKAEGVLKAVRNFYKPIA